MKDYLLISSGSQGTFHIQGDTLQELLEAAKDQLKAGQQCNVFTRHSELLAGEVQVVKSAVQLQVDAIEAALPVADQPVKP